MAGTFVLFRMSGSGGSDSAGAPLPNPNGYDDFLLAGQKVTVPKALGPNPTADDLRAFVSLNSDALKLLRAGLSKECRIPINFSAEYYVETNQIIALECKALQMVLDADGRLAEMQHRTEDAEISYLDAVRFGQESSRGGFKINLAVGGHGETTSLARLRELLNCLNATQCRDAIKTLSALDRKREPVADVLARDKKWWHNHASLGDQFKYIPVLAKDPSLNPLNMSPEELEKSGTERQRQTRQLILDLAARCYQFEKGTRPKSPADLIPAFLTAIPQDPNTGTNMIITFAVSAAN
jgi:hypothetical protein